MRFSIKDVIVILIMKMTMVSFIFSYVYFLVFSQDVGSPSQQIPN